MSRRATWLLSILLIAVGCAASAPPSVSEGAHRAVAGGAVLLDVRTPEEFGDEHLDGAINIPVDDLPARIAELDGQHDVVVYCRSGNRSARAAALLRARDHAVIDLGPMKAW